LCLGFGAIFCVITLALVYMDTTFGDTKVTSEQFNTAGRSVKIGLTASVIVSQWTWAATLLQSSNVAWNYGVSGPFWYASGATIQVLLFGILAIELKKKARKAHTVCEMVNIRWGGCAHIVFINFCFAANIIVTSMLILGGAATVEALTGMNKTAAGFLIPIFVIPYTMAGGLKATFMASYLHTAIIFFILLVCVSTVYVGKYGPNSIYDMLEKTVSFTEDECKAIFSTDGKGLTADTTFFEKGTYSCGQWSVCGNDMFSIPKPPLSYLTMLSTGGTRFGIINIVGNFGTVFVDQSYWQSAIAAKPAAAHKGYLLGGMVWFTIPFALATAMGLASTALQLPITSAESGSGLVPPAVGTHLFGAAGSWMIAIMLFMAIVSTGSAESIAVSSLVSYDIYRKYINKNATGAQILMVSRIAIVFWGIFMGVLSMFLDWLGLGLGWVYQFMGNAIGSAVPPLWFLLTWKDCSAAGAIAGAIGGLALAMVGWFVTASTLCEGGGLPNDDCAGTGDCETGFINLDTLGSLDANLCGNLLALLGSTAICVIISCMKPQKYDWSELDKGLEMVENDMSGLDEEDYTEEELNAALTWIKRWGYGLTFVLIIVWPVASFPAGKFTKGYFTLWVIISVIWGFLATVIIILYPIIESLGDFKAMCSKMGGSAPPAASK
jgi:SSS family transporter